LGFTFLIFSNTNVVVEGLLNTKNKIGDFVVYILINLLLLLYKLHNTHWGNHPCLFQNIYLIELQGF